MRALRLDKSSQNKLILEAVLQHYGIPTRLIDAVDNHWVALWFGLHEYESRRASHEVHALYRRRRMPLPQGCCLAVSTLSFQYVLLMCVREGHVMDLRNKIPSTFLRPHAQHAVMLRNDEPDDSFDMSRSVIGILRMRIDLADRWIGHGQLASYANMFPSPMHDYGYGILLQQQSFFEGRGFRITRYAYDVE